MIHRLSSRQLTIQLTPTKKMLPCVTSEKQSRKQKRLAQPKKYLIVANLSATISMEIYRLDLPPAGKGAICMSTCE